MKSQKIASCVTYPKEAHMSEQTDQTNPGNDVSDKRTHLAMTHAKSVARGGEVGPADPMGQLNLAHLPSRCILVGSLTLSSRRRLLMFQSIEMAGTDFKDYKRDLPPLNQHTPLWKSLSHTLL